MAVAVKGLSVASPPAQLGAGEKTASGTRQTHPQLCPEAASTGLEKSPFRISLLAASGTGKASCQCLSPKHRAGRHGGLGLALQRLLPKAFFFFRIWKNPI